MAIDRETIERNVAFMDYAGNVKKQRWAWTNDRARTLSKLISNQAEEMYSKDAEIGEMDRYMRTVIDDTIAYRESYQLGLNDELPPGYDDAPSKRTLDELRGSMARMREYNEYGKYQEYLKFGEDLKTLRGYSDRPELHNTIALKAMQYVDPGLEDVRYRFPKDYGVRMAAKVSKSLDAYIQENKDIVDGKTEPAEVDAERSRSRDIPTLDYAREQLYYYGGLVCSGESIFREKVQAEFEDVDMEWAASQSKIDEVAVSVDRDAERDLDEGHDFDEYAGDEPSVFAERSEIQKMMDDADNLYDARRLQLLYDGLNLCGQRDETGRWTRLEDQAFRDVVVDTYCSIAGEKDFNKVAQLIELPGYEATPNKPGDGDGSGGGDGMGVAFEPAEPVIEAEVPDY